MFIPHFHFQTADEKLKAEWCDKVIQHYLYNSSVNNLLWDKNVDEIEKYAKGKFDLEPFRAMFKSLRKKQAAQNNGGVQYSNTNDLDTSGIQWDCLPLIPPKLNAAVSTAQKIPIEITCTCQDPLAQKKKQEDLDFLKNRSFMEEVIQPLYDSMNLGKAEIGETKYSSFPFAIMPMDLDPNDADEFRLFAELIYKLATETAFETGLQSFYDLKKVIQIKLLEIYDQYKFGVSVNTVLDDKNTDLPNIEYTHPSLMRIPDSDLPDFSDNVIRLREYVVTPFELFKYFPDEICDENFLATIVNGKDKNDKSGYCSCNKRSNIAQTDFGTYKMNLLRVEVKSVDSAMFAKKKSRNNGEVRYFTDDEKKCVGRVWGQNTYCFYWLNATKHFFGINRLGFAHRTKGSEIYQGFSTNIYRSQKKSAVELSIGENKKAQMADIKLQHAIIMSKPSGGILDIKYYRNVVDSLTDEIDKYTLKELVDSAVERNIHIIDSDNFETRQGAGQFAPYREVMGGLKLEEIAGYYKVQFEARQNIAAFTGISDYLTATGSNPEGLVGFEQLRLSQSINALYYVNEAIVSQYTGVFNVWAYHLKEAIKRGGAGKQAIINMIGTNKVNIIAGLDDVPLHNIGVKITLGQREEERAQLRMEIQRMRQAGILNSADEYFILRVLNPKDGFWLMAVKELKFQRKQDQRQQMQMQSLENMKQQEGQNMLQNTQAQAEGKIAQIGAETQGKAQLMQLGSKLGLTETQIAALIKRQLQKERIADQKDSKLSTIYANKNVDAQQPVMP